MRTVDNSRDPTKDGQQNVDQLDVNECQSHGERTSSRVTYKICTATSFEEHAERWQDDGET
jgi:hypothetical protein